MIAQIVGEEEFERTVLQSKLPVLVDFWARWCGPCQAVAPILEELAQEYAGKLNFAKVDVDENSSLAARYGIAAIPTMLVFKGNQPVKQVTGYRPKKELKKILDTVLGAEPTSPQ
jgi:thioredoxin